jgi:hypothetical protein
MNGKIHVMGGRGDHTIEKERSLFEMEDDIVSIVDES